MPGVDFPYSVRRSDRARRVHVRVAPGGEIEVVLPRRAPDREASRAVRELSPWIRRRLADVERQRALVAARGDTVPYLGRPLTLVPEPGRTRVHRRGDTLLVPADGAAQAEAIERWYRRAARAEFTPKLDAACAESGTAYTQLTIRGQRTRWGSCSRAGAIALNWRLLLAPEPVLDYVIWHEVCHLRVMDHSPRFWALVSEHCPGYKEPRAWLRRHGATLVLTGGAPAAE